MRKDAGVEPAHRDERILGLAIRRADPCVRKWTPDHAKAVHEGSVAGVIREEQGGCK